MASLRVNMYRENVGGDPKAESHRVTLQTDSVFGINRREINRVSTSVMAVFASTCRLVTLFRFASKPSPKETGHFPETICQIPAYQA